jgi:16S rRNA (adenine1518-N6/adenine1519-N6)-dimethyltransferase
LNNLVRAKKFLGQHFLKDESIAQQITESIEQENDVLEIGAGMGVLTKYLLENNKVKDLKIVEIDKESVDYLLCNYPMLSNKIYNEDFLKMDLNAVFPNKMTIIGNFPYNISNQILFKVFENRTKVEELVGMFQKEVAERISARPKTKAYGILSVLLSAFYDIEYLFTVSESVFSPIPKVKSAVVRMKRNDVKTLPCEETLFIKIIKTAFNQRRKMLRSALKPLNISLEALDSKILSSRAEELSVKQFIELTNILENQI